MKNVSKLNYWLLVASIFCLDLEADIYSILSYAFIVSPAVISAFLLQPSIRKKLHLLPISPDYSHFPNDYRPGTGVIAINIPAFLWYTVDAIHSLDSRLVKFDGLLGEPSQTALYSWLAGIVSGITIYSILTATKKESG